MTTHQQSTTHKTRNQNPQSIKLKTYYTSTTWNVGSKPPTQMLIQIPANLQPPQIANQNRERELERERKKGEKDRREKKEEREFESEKERKEFDR